jgi:large subunit ribosomal protein L17
MRHRKKFNHLGRKSAHRQETLSSWLLPLFCIKELTLQLAKAKALRVFVEPLITKSKVDSTHSRRTVFGYLRSKRQLVSCFVR